MPIPRPLRFQTLRRDGFRCYYCHAADVELHVDHVIPEALGGITEPSNLVAACEPCNTGKGAVPPDAPLVAQVAADAERWARAMQAAAANKQALEADRDNQINDWIDAICVLHESVEYQLPFMPTADRWVFRDNIKQFLNAGLDIHDLFDAMKITMRRIAQGQVYDSEIDHSGWRYFCGVAWKMLRGYQDVARELINTGVI